MTGPRIVAAALAAVTLAACGDRPAAPKPEPARALRAGEPCPVTLPTGPVPGADKGFTYGSRSLAVALWPRGRLPAGELPDGGAYAEIRPDGSIVAKLGWWRGVQGSLTVSGERLDARAAPLRAHIPDGYGATGFQPTSLTFPTAGCWRFVGRVGRESLAVVVLVRKLKR